MEPEFKPVVPGLESREKLDGIGTSNLTGTANRNLIPNRLFPHHCLVLPPLIPGEDHCGYDKVTHGGIVFSALDDVMANWLFLKGLRAYTAKCEIRYKDALPIGTAVRLEGKCIKQRGRLTVMQGTMTREDNNQVVAECEASFMLAS